MAQLAIGLAGGFAATTVGGPAFFGLGFAAASFLGGRLFGPGLPAVYGPRLTDLRVQSSAQGTAKIRVHGTHRVPAQVIWSSGIKETVVKDEVGGKGFLSPSQTIVNFSYSVDLALFWCEGPQDGSGMAAVLQIQADGKMVADYTATTGPTEGNGTWVHYLGTETQEPSPLIQAEKGIANTSAYRGDMYSTVENFQLANHGKRVPNFTAVVASEASATAPQTNVALGAAGGAPASASVFHANRDLNLMLWKEVGTTGWAIYAADSFNYVGHAVWRDTLNLASEGNLDVINNTSSNMFHMDRLADHVYGLSAGGSSSAGLIKAKIFDGAITAVLGNESNFLNVGEWQRGHDIYTGWGLLPVTFTDVENNQITDRLTIGVSFGENPVQMQVTILDGKMASLGEINRAMDLTDDTVGVPIVDKNYRLWIAGESTTGGSPTVLRLYEFSVLNGVDLIKAHDITSAFSFIFGDGNRADLIYRFDAHEIILFRSGYAWKFDIDSKAITGAALQVYNHGFTVPAFQALLSAGPDADGIMLTKGQVGGADQDFTLNRLDVDAWTVELAKYTLSDYSGVGNMSAGAMYSSALNAYVGQEPATVHTLFLDRVTDATKLLSDIMSDELTRGGELTAGDLDVSALTGINIRGYIVPGQIRRRDAIAPLLQTHFVDAIVSDDKLKFVVRGGATAASLVDDDLGAYPAGANRSDKVREAIKAESETPYVIDLVYIERESQWQEGSQQSKRIDAVEQSRSQTTIQTNEVFTASEARQVVTIMVVEAWLARRELSTAINHGRLALDPSDRLQITHDGVVDTARILQTDFRDDYVIPIKAVIDDASIYTRFEIGVGANLVLPPGIKLVRPSEFLLLDTALLRDEDNYSGYYTASGPLFEGGGQNWPGATIMVAEAFVQTDDFDHPLDFSRDFKPLVTHTTTMRWGRTNGTVADQARWTVIDRTSTIKVTWIAGTEPTTVTEANFLNNALLLLVGDEIIAVRDVTDNGDGTLTFSTLLRGRLGTEDKIAGHGTAERVVVLEATTLKDVPSPKISHLTGLTGNRFYRADTIGANFPSLRERIFSNSSRRQQPLSPYYVRASRNATFDLTIQWERRTRLIDIWRVDLTTPLGEDSETYDLVIYGTNGTTVVRTFAGLTGKSQVYLRATQVSDGVGAIRVVAPFTDLTVGNVAGSPTQENHDAELATMDGWTNEQNGFTNVADSSGRPDPQDGTRMFQALGTATHRMSSEIDLVADGISTSDIDNSLLGIDLRCWFGRNGNLGSTTGSFMQFSFRYKDAAKATLKTESSTAAPVTQDLTVQGGAWESYNVKLVGAIPNLTRYIDVVFQISVNPTQAESDLFIDDVACRIGKPTAEITLGVFQNSAALNIGRGIERRVTL